MIHDHLNSLTTQWLERYHPVLQEVFDWLRALPPDPPHGITQLRGEQLYVNVHGYDTLPVEQCAWESHRHTIDLQYCIDGGEMIDWVAGHPLNAAGEYNTDKDTQKWSGNAPGSIRLRMVPTAYVIFLPGELHRPKVEDGTHPAVRKLVVKIHQDLLDT